MEIREQLKSTQKGLSRCTKTITSVKVLRIPGLIPQVIDLSDPLNKELEQRLLLRKEISDLNKEINKDLVKFLKNVDFMFEENMKRYWDEIILGFASVDKSFSKEAFCNTFFSNKNSPYNRRFADCLDAKTMEHYSLYLSLYKKYFPKERHRPSIRTARSIFVSKNVPIVFSETLLPKNWSKVCEQLNLLKNLANVIDLQNNKDKASNTPEIKEDTYLEERQ